MAGNRSDASTFAAGRGRQVYFASKAAQTVLLVFKVSSVGCLLQVKNYYCTDSIHQDIS